SFSQAEPITIPVPVQQPKDFVLWSLFNFVFCNACCLGFCALAYSIKSRDRIVARDLVGAHTYGKKAKVLNIVTLFVGILVTIASIVLVIYCLPL
ncbi:IFM1 protein, partial [Alectura lathami]|nr:IFM1 protein [Alectura lathami]